QGYLEQAADPTDTRAKVVRMTKRGEAVKTACVEVREELNRKLAGALGMDDARRLETNLDAAAGSFGKIVGTTPE
ncbi:MAG: MarR family winged helix-turn-helix transcriptional regulator, partial [Terriglobales bacterium]